MRSRKVFSWARMRSESFPQGIFGIEGLNRPEDFSRIADDRVRNAREKLRAWRTIQDADPMESIEVLDEVSNSLCRIADAAEFIRNVHSNSEWIERATHAVERVSGFMSEANIDSCLYKHAQSVKDRANHSLPCGAEHAKVVSAMVHAMENEGVALDPVKKQKLIELQEADLVKSFSIIKPAAEGQETVGDWVEVPDGPRRKEWYKILQKRRNSKGREEVLIPTGKPALIPHLIRDIHSRSTRQLVWEIGNRKTAAMVEKEQSLDDLIHLRRRQAEIRGYVSWNHYAQRESILTPLGGPRAVDTFLGDLWRDLCPGLARELKVLSDLNDGHPVEAWDIDFLIQKWKDLNPEMTASTEAIQSKLTFQRILRGGQLVFDKVLGVDLQYDGSAGNLWHEDAFRLKLSRAGQQPFAYLYLDPYQRESKAVHSAQFTISGSKMLLSGQRQIPQTALVLGLPSDPALPLPISVSQTFFHELGHAAHSLLSETKLQHFSGSRGAIDFVEFPSHLFEFFGTDPTCLGAFMGSEIDSSFLEDYAKKRNPFGHIEAAQQLAYAMLDQVYYSTGSPSNVSEHLPDTNILKKSHVMSLLIPTTTAHFEHLVHYGGSYYSYLLCRSVAADVWNKSFKADPLSRSAGERLEAFLKQGSVEQSLDAIYKCITDTQHAGKICTRAFIEDLKSCEAIHA